MASTFNAGVLKFKSLQAKRKKIIATQRASIIDYDQRLANGKKFIDELRVGKWKIEAEKRAIDGHVTMVIEYPNKDILSETIWDIIGYLSTYGFRVQYDNKSSKTNVRFIIKWK